MATSQAGVILGKDGLLHKAANTIGLSNVFNVGADARVNLLGNEVGIDGAVGIGESGIGAHASADADILGQKAKVHADVLDGHKIDQHNHEVFKDSNNRQYVLQRQYIGSQSVLVRKYLDNGQIYLDGANDDNVLQHKQVDESKVYDNKGGWWDVQTKRYYNRFGEWVKGRVWDPRILNHISYVEPEAAVDDRYPTGGWQKDGNYVEIYPMHSSHQKEVNGGWQKDGSYIAVDPVHPNYQNEVIGGWQEDGSYIAVDPVHSSQREEYLTSVPKRAKREEEYVLLFPQH